jgi:hypothetical protein
MIARMTMDGRFFGFNAGDWSLLLTGVTLAGLLALLM